MKNENAKDPVLEILNGLTEIQNAAIPITLLVNGILISCNLISFKTYLELNKSICVVNDKFIELSKQLSDSTAFDLSQKNFFECIHINNVRIYGGNLNLKLPTTASLRIPFTSINGYFLGESEV
jgi:hypothetical protein